MLADTHHPAADQLKQRLPVPVLRRARLHAELAGMDALHAAQAVTHAQRRCVGDSGDEARFWRALYVELAPLAGTASVNDPIADALSKLGLESRTALLLRLGEQMKPAAIAKALDEPESRTAEHLAAAVARMRVLVGGGRSDSIWLAELGAWLHAHEPASARIQRTAAAPAALSKTPGGPAWSDRNPGDRRRGRRLWLLSGLMLALVALGLLRQGADDWMTKRTTVPPVVVDPVDALLSLPTQDFSLIGSDIDLELLARLDFYLWMLTREGAVATRLAPDTSASAATVNDSNEAAPAAQWQGFDSTERTRRLQRFSLWQAFSPAQHAALRLNLPSWLRLGDQQRRQLLGQQRAFAAQTSEQQERQEQSFEALPPPARRALLPAIAGGDARDLARELFAFVPMEQETATLRMLGSLDAEAHDTLRQVSRRLAPWQREALRVELLAQPPDQRAAWLQQRLGQR
ncbi:MAG: DUF3106 domain-containing protein [Pseudomarimonas sp.]